MAVVRYLVPDVDEAVGFYADRLGFELVRRWGRAFAVVAHGDLRLWLSGPDSSAARPMADGRRPEPGGWNRVVIEVADLAGTVAALERAGITFRNDAVAGPGGRQILLDDPAGNPVELFEAR
jgi:catechol 2,3-dioxygenase-like lactoylglutathione lyase family enzyme